MLRDGLPTYLPVREEHLELVLGAIRSAINSLAAPDAPAPQRGRARRVRPLLISGIYQGNNFGQHETYPDGVRCIVKSNFGWFGLHVLVFIPLLVAVLMLLSIFITLHPLSMFLSIVCFLLFHVIVYGQTRPPERREQPDAILDVIGDTVSISYTDFHGLRRSWKRDEIASFRIGGPLWRLMRVGSLYIRLANGNKVTLLTCHPVALVKNIGQDLAAALYANDQVGRASARAPSPPGMPPPAAAQPDR
jgi:hypothetical protein